MFLSLKREVSVSQKDVIINNHKNASNLWKLYFLPKIHKRLSNVPGWLVISNCRTSTNNTSDFLDYHLKPLMERIWSYIEDSGDFTEKIKRISNIQDDVILIIADVVELYLSILHDLGLKALKEALGKKESVQISTSNLAKWLNLYVKIIIFILMERTSNNFLVLLYALNSHLHMHVHSWTKFNQNFWKFKITNY